MRFYSSCNTMTIKLTLQSNIKHICTYIIGVSHVKCLNGVTAHIVLSQL